MKVLLIAAALLLAISNSSAAQSEFTIVGSHRKDCKIICSDVQMECNEFATTAINNDAGECQAAIHSILPDVINVRSGITEDSDEPSGCVYKSVGGGEIQPVVNTRGLVRGCEADRGNPMDYQASKVCRCSHFEK